MTDTNTNDSLDFYNDAMALLAGEKEALKGADFARLETLYEQKQELLERIAARRDTLSREQLERMARESRANDKLLGAAQRGLRAVARRLSETHRAAEHLDTYTESGKREDLGPVKPSFEKRA